MAVIFADGASTYDSNANMTLVKGYSVVSTFPSFRQAGAWGAGSYSFNYSLNTAGASYVSRSFPAASTATWGFRFQGSGGNGTTAPNVSTMGQFGPINLYYDGTGHIQVYNTVTSTLLFTTAVLVTSWHYFEIQVSVSSTVGTVTVWVDGTQVYAGTALNTGTGNIGGFLFGAFNASFVSGATVSVTDIYVTDNTNASGAGNTGALGPVRVETLAPSADGSNNAFTPVSNLASANQYQPQTTTGFVAVQNVTLANVAFSGTLPSPFEVDFAPGTNVFQAASNSTNTATIFTTTAGTGGFAVSGNGYYTVSALINTTNGTGLTNTFGIQWYDSGGAALTLSTTTYTSQAAGTWSTMTLTAQAPSNAAFAALYHSGSINTTNQITGVTFAATSIAGGLCIVAPSTTHYQKVNVAIAGTGSFNRNAGGSANVGDKDSYAMADLASTAGTPLAVVVTDIALKENTNPRSVAPILKSGATTYVGTSQGLNNDTAYHAFQSIWELDPNTSAAWTIANANAAEAGIEISA